MFLVKILNHFVLGLYQYNVMINISKNHKDWNDEFETEINEQQRQDILGKIKANRFVLSKSVGRKMKRFEIER